MTRAFVEESILASLRSELARNRLSIERIQEAARAVLELVRKFPEKIPNEKLLELSKKHPECARELLRILASEEHTANAEAAAMICIAIRRNKHS